MLRLVIGLSLLFVAATAQANPPRCFCPPSYNYYYPPKEVVRFDNKVEVINRQLSLGVKQGERDLVAEQAAQHALAMAYDAIPISQKYTTHKTFRFKNTWPVYRTEQKQKVVQQETVTHTYYGYIQNNVVVQNGVVSLDVSNEKLMQLITPQLTPLGK